MIKFTYTKKNGEVSERVGLLVSSPNKNYGVLDISDYTAEEQSELDTQFKLYQARKAELLAQLDEEFNIPKSFKNFVPECMSDVEVI